MGSAREGSARYRTVACLLVGHMPPEAAVELDLAAPAALEAGGG